MFTQEFNIPSEYILELAHILSLIQTGLPVIVFGKNYEEIARGVPRHLVQPDSCAFAFVITPESRLRLSGMFESFVALKDIEGILPEEAER